MRVLYTGINGEGRLEAAECAIEDGCAVSVGGVGGALGVQSDSGA